MLPPGQGTLVDHHAIPHVAWDSFCPFRPLQDGRAFPILRAFVRWQRYAVLPAAGGLDDQDESMLEAFDVMAESLAQGERAQTPKRSR